ncbi:MAG: hypothetical protein KF900_04490 [Bacteroidetes bacterium]|nr:hypothetical protein [Bacteroidota bacterium]
MKTIFIPILVVVFCVNVNAQIVTAFAGTGISGYSGDGGLATAAKIGYINSICSDIKGNIYFTDLYNNRVRKIDVNGIITTVAGTGVAGYSGDGGLATLAELNYPSYIYVDATGNIYISENNNHCVRKIDTNGIINTIVGVSGAGTAGYSGDGGLAVLATVNRPANIIKDTIGNIFITDMNNHCIRKIDTSGIITTIAGNGTQGYSGDGGLATSAQLKYPMGLTIDNAGNLFFTDFANHRVRKITADGIITTIAGNGMEGYEGNGSAAAEAALKYPSDVDFDTLGNLYITDQFNSCIRKINTNGIITTIAGTGEYGFNGNSLQATETQFHYPSSITLRNGRIYIADSENFFIRTFCANNIELTAVPQSICAGESTTLSVSSLNSYTWSSGGVSLAQNTTISVTPSVSTTYAVNAIDNYGCQNKAQILVSVSPCTGVDELENGNDELKIYPNPANEMVNVESSLSPKGGTVEIFIYDILGNIVISSAELTFHNS